MARLATVVTALALASSGVVAKHAQRHVPRINYLPSVVKRQFDDIFDDITDITDDITIDDTIDDIFSDFDDFFTDLPTDVDDFFTDIPTDIFSDLPTIPTTISFPSATSNPEVDDSDDCVDFPVYSGTTPPAGNTASRTSSGSDPTGTSDSSDDNEDAASVPTAAMGSVLAVALGLGALML
jgi:hypothetical protein